jgi:hypothetical protein
MVYLRHISVKTLHKEDVDNIDIDDDDDNDTKIIF